MFQVESIHQNNVIKLTIEATPQSESDAQKINDEVKEQQRLFIGNFQLWINILPIDRLVFGGACHLMKSQIMVRKVLGLKKVVIQIAPGNENSVVSGGFIREAYECHKIEVRIVESDEAAGLALGLVRQTAG